MRMEHKKNVILLAVVLLVALGAALLLSFDSFPSRPGPDDVPDGKERQITEPVKKFARSGKFVAFEKNEQDFVIRAFDPERLVEATYRFRVDRSTLAAPSATSKEYSFLLNEQGEFETRVRSGTPVTVFFAEEVAADGNAPQATVVVFHGFPEEDPESAADIVPFEPIDLQKR